MTTDDTPPLTEEQVKEIAARRAAALKRVQEMHQQKGGHSQFAEKGGKAGRHGAPPKGRMFRHQGR